MSSTSFKHYLGLDTAQNNLGLTILQWDGIEVKLLESTKVEVDAQQSDFLTNNQVVTKVRHFIKNFNIVAGALESPAYGYKRGMVSIGTIHGVLCQEVLDQCIPFLYVTPGKLKYFAAGPAKGKAHPKSVIIKAVKEIYGKPIEGGNWDSDRADSTVLSTMAFCAEWARFQPQAFYPTPWNQSWALQVFNSKKLTGKSVRRPEGIFRRPCEFFWKPGLTK